MSDHEPQQCGHSIILWPDMEAVELRCELPVGHEGRHRDYDSTWEDSDLETHRWDE